MVLTSRVWQTNCALVRRGDESFCIDSPVLPDELELLPTVADQSNFPVMGRLCTHADWDHVLAGYAFPDAPLGCAESSAPRLREAGHALREFDEEHYIVRPGPLHLGGEPFALPVPGHIGIGDAELDLHDATGHTSDGMAIWVPWARTLICGDYLSPVELPMLSESGDLVAYLETLERLESVVGEAEHVIPGHGEILDSERALAILREDRTYLTELRDQGEATPLPMARATDAQRRLHTRNAQFLAGPPADEL